MYNVQHSYDYGSLSVRCSVSTVVSPLPSTLWIRYAPLIGNKKYLMMDQCATCSGQTLKVRTS